MNRTCPIFLNKGKLTGLETMVFVRIKSSTKNVLWKDMALEIEGSDIKRKLKPVIIIYWGCYCYLNKKKYLWKWGRLFSKKQLGSTKVFCGYSTFSFNHRTHTLNLNLFQTTVIVAIPDLPSIDAVIPGLEFGIGLGGM